jgi:DNA-binding response OmpR family regulator
MPEDAFETHLKASCVQVRVRPSILAVTEQIAFAHSIKWLLNEHEFHVHVANGTEALSHTKAIRPGAILVDVAPTVAHAGHVVRSLHGTVAGVPIITLGANESPYEIEYLRSAGSDDHVASREREHLAQRIRTRLRVLSLSAANMPFASFELDEETLRVRIRGRFVTLNQIEWSLLAYLTRQPYCIVRPTELVRDVRRAHAALNERTLRGHIYSLRRKLEDNPREPKRLLTVLANGYVLRPDA